MENGLGRTGEVLETGEAGKLAEAPPLVGSFTRVVEAAVAARSGDE